MDVATFLSILSLVFLAILVFLAGGIIFILKKGINEVVKGMESINRKLENIEKRIDKS